MVRGEDLADRGRELARRFLNSVDLDQEDGTSVGRIARVVVGLDRADGHTVHHLERRGHDPVSDDSRNSLACGVDAWERREQGCHARRYAQQLDLDLRDRAQRAFRPNQHAAQVETHAVRRVAADPVHAAVGEHDLHAEHMVGRDAVVETVRAA